MRGRPRIPTNIHIVKGTGEVHPERINPDEPEYETEIPIPPIELSSDALIEWNRITPLLETMGLIAGINRATLAQYCQTYGRWLEAERHIADEGAVVMFCTETRRGKMGSPKDDKEGEEVPLKIYTQMRKNPWLDVSLKSVQECRKLANEFGLTPASAGKVSAKPQATKPKQKGAERFFK